MRKLGHVQVSVLESLVEHKIWSRRGLGGWLWDTPSNTERVMDSLVKRGLATMNGNTYLPTEQGTAALAEMKKKAGL